MTLLPEEKGGIAAAPDALHDEEPLDIQIALLATLAGRDSGGDTTEEVDIVSLTEAEKRALLTLLQQRMERDSTGSGSQAAPAPGGKKSL